MKRRKGKERKSTGRSQPIRLAIERLETRQLLAGFASIVVPGAIGVGTVDFIESASQINVAVVEPVCSVEVKAGADHCQEKNDLSSTGNLAIGRPLPVGDGFVFHSVVHDFAGNDSVTNESNTLEVSIGPFLQPSRFDPITVVAEEPVVEMGPINQQSRPLPEVGVYFTEPQNLPGDQPGDTTTASTVTTADESRIASLGRVQQFALLSPADLPGPNLPSLDGSVVVNPVQGSYSPTISEVDAVFEDLDKDLLSDDGNFKPTDVSDLGLGGPETGSSKPTGLVNPVSNPLLEPTLGHLSTPALRVAPAVPLNVLQDVLQSMDFEEARPDAPIDQQAPINPDLPAEDADNKKVVDGIYLVEGVILLAAIPRSLDRRGDDEMLDESCE